MCVLWEGTCLQVHVYEHEGQRSTQVSFLRSVTHLVFSDGISLLAWSSTSRQGWPASEPQRSSCLHFSSAGTINVGHYTQHFYIGSKDQTQLGSTVLTSSSPSVIVIKSESHEARTGLTLFM